MSTENAFFPPAETPFFGAARAVFGLDVARCKAATLGNLAQMELDSLVWRPWPMHDLRDIGTDYLDAVKELYRASRDLQYVEAGQVAEEARALRKVIQAGPHRIGPIRAHASVLRRAAQEEMEQIGMRLVARLTEACLSLRQIVNDREAIVWGWRQSWLWLTLRDAYGPEIIAIARQDAWTWCNYFATCDLDDIHLAPGPVGCRTILLILPHGQIGNVRAIARESGILAVGRIGPMRALDMVVLELLLPRPPMIRL